MINTRAPEERQFLTSDNVELFYRYWPATSAGATPKVIVLFHRGHEHSGRLQHIIDELAMPDTAFYAWGCPWARALAGPARVQSIAGSFGSGCG
ncbi:Putative lysophospholipase [Citrobacter koseri]|uniref:Lysophospholipase n=1 Tax=Citrobacter koseri TaxID=545 RepID=A0A2X2WHM5_CITKO|nr:Putative lysophospholipase [Citrobacter koseri]